MKLLCCRYCWDIFNLTLDIWKSCSCGSVSGRYVAYGKAEFKESYKGQAVLLNLNSEKFLEAVNLVYGTRTRPATEQWVLHTLLIERPSESFKLAQTTSKNHTNGIEWRSPEDLHKGRCYIKLKKGDYCTATVMFGFYPFPLVQLDDGSHVDLSEIECWCELPTT